MLHNGLKATAALAGGALGAVAGGTLGNAATDPGCPTGYVLRPHGTAFVAGPVYPDAVYGAPGWYDPWIWYGGHWIYRPYPTIATGSTFTIGDLAPVAARRGRGAMLERSKA